MRKGKPRHVPMFLRSENKKILFSFFSYFMSKNDIQFIFDHYDIGLIVLTKIHNIRKRYEEDKNNLQHENNKNDLEDTESIDEKVRAFFLNYKINSNEDISDHKKEKPEKNKKGKKGSVNKEKSNETNEKKFTAKNNYSIITRSKTEEIDPLKNDENDSPNSNNAHEENKPQNEDITNTNSYHNNNDNHSNNTSDILKQTGHINNADKSRVEGVKQESCETISESGESNTLDKKNINISTKEICKNVNNNNNTLSIDEEIIDKNNNLNDQNFENAEIKNKNNIKTCINETKIEDKNGQKEDKNIINKNKADNTILSKQVENNNTEQEYTKFQEDISMLIENNKNETCKNKLNSEERNNTNGETQKEKELDDILFPVRKKNETYKKFSKRINKTKTNEFINYHDDHCFYITDLCRKGTMLSLRKNEVLNKKNAKNAHSHHKFINSFGLNNSFQVIDDVQSLNNMYMNLKLFDGQLNGQINENNLNDLTNLLKSKNKAPFHINNSANNNISSNTNSYISSNDNFNIPSSYFIYDYTNTDKFAYTLNNVENLEHIHNYQNVHNNFYPTSPEYTSNNNINNNTFIRNSFNNKNDAVNFNINQNIDNCSNKSKTDIKDELNSTPIYSSNYQPTVTTFNNNKKTYIKTEKTKNNSKNGNTIKAQTDDNIIKQQDVKQNSYQNFYINQIKNEHITNTINSQNNIKNVNFHSNNIPLIKNMPNGCLFYQNDTFGNTIHNNSYNNDINAAISSATTSSIAIPTATNASISSPTSTTINIDQCYNQIFESNGIIHSNPISNNDSNNNMVDLNHIDHKAKNINMTWGDHNSKNTHNHPNLNIQTETTSINNDYYHTNNPDINENSSLHTDEENNLEDNNNMENASCLKKGINRKCYSNNSTINNNNNSDNNPENRNQNEYNDSCDGQNNYCQQNNNNDDNNYDKKYSATYIRSNNYSNGNIYDDINYETKQSEGIISKNQMKNNCFRDNNKFNPTDFKEVSPKSTSINNISNSMTSNDSSMNQYNNANSRCNNSVGNNNTDSNQFKQNINRYNNSNSIELKTNSQLNDYSSNSNTILLMDECDSNELLNPHSSDNNYLNDKDLLHSNNMTRNCSYNNDNRSNTFNELVNNMLFQNDGSPQSSKNVIKNYSTIYESQTNKLETVFPNVQNNNKYMRQNNIHQTNDTTRNGIEQFECIHNSDNYYINDNNVSNTSNVNDSKNINRGNNSEDFKTIKNEIKYPAINSETSNYVYNPQNNIMYIQNTSEQITKGNNNSYIQYNTTYSINNENISTNYLTMNSLINDQNKLENCSKNKNNVNDSKINSIYDEKNQKNWDNTSIPIKNKHENNIYEIKENDINSQEIELNDKTTQHFENTDKEGNENNSDNNGNPNFVNKNIENNENIANSIGKEQNYIFQENLQHLDTKNVKNNETYCLPSNEMCQVSQKQNNNIHVYDEKNIEENQTVMFQNNLQYNQAQPYYQPKTKGIYDDKTNFNPVQNTNDLQRNTNNIITNDPLIKNIYENKNASFINSKQSVILPKNDDLDNSNFKGNNENNSKTKNINEFSLNKNYKNSINNSQKHQRDADINCYDINTKYKENLKKQKNSIVSTVDKSDYFDVENNEIHGKVDNDGYKGAEIDKQNNQEMNNNFCNRTKYIKVETITDSIDDKNNNSISSIRNNTNKTIYDIYMNDTMQLNENINNNKNLNIQNNSNDIITKDNNTNNLGNIDNNFTNSEYSQFHTNNSVKTQHNPELSQREMNYLYTNKMALIKDNINIDANDNIINLQNFNYINDQTNDNKNRKMNSLTMKMHSNASSYIFDNKTNNNSEEQKNNDFNLGLNPVKDKYDNLYANYYVNDNDHINSNDQQIKNSNLETQDTLNRRKKNTLKTISMEQLPFHNSVNNFENNYESNSSCYKYTKGINTTPMLNENINNACINQEIYDNNRQNIETPRSKNYPVFNMGIQNNKANSEALDENGQIQSKNVLTNNLFKINKKYNSNNAETNNNLIYDNNENAQYNYLNDLHTNGRNSIYESHMDLPPNHPHLLYLNNLNAKNLENISERKISIPNEYINFNSLNHIYNVPQFDNLPNNVNSNTRYNNNNNSNNSNNSNICDNSINNTNNSIDPNNNNTPTVYNTEGPISNVDNNYNITNMPLDKNSIITNPHYSSNTNDNKNSAIYNNIRYSNRTFCNYNNIKGSNDNNIYIPNNNIKSYNDNIMHNLSNNVKGYNNSSVYTYRNNNIATNGKNNKEPNKGNNNLYNFNNYKNYIHNDSSNLINVKSEHPEKFNYENNLLDNVDKTNKNNINRQIDNEELNSLITEAHMRSFDNFKASEENSMRNNINNRFINNNNNDHYQMMINNINLYNAYKYLYRNNNKYIYNTNNNDKSSNNINIYSDINNFPQKKINTYTPNNLLTSQNNNVFNTQDNMHQDQTNPIILYNNINGTKNNLISHIKSDIPSSGCDTNQSNNDMKNENGFNYLYNGIPFDYFKNDMAFIYNNNIRNTGNIIEGTNIINDHNKQFENNDERMKENRNNNMYANLNNPSNNTIICKDPKNYYIKNNFDILNNIDNLNDIKNENNINNSNTIINSSVDLQNNKTKNKDNPNYNVNNCNENNNNADLKYIHELNKFYNSKGTSYKKINDRINDTMNNINMTSNMNTTETLGSNVDDTYKSISNISTTRNRNSNFNMMNDNQYIQLQDVAYKISDNYDNSVNKEDTESCPKKPSNLRNTNLIDSMNMMYLNKANKNIYNHPYYKNGIDENYFNSNMNISLQSEFSDPNNIIHNNLKKIKTNKPYNQSYPSNLPYNRNSNYSNNNINEISQINEGKNRDTANNYYIPPYMNPNDQAPDFKDNYLNTCKNNIDIDNINYYKAQQYYANNKFINVNYDKNIYTNEPNKYSKNYPNEGFRENIDGTYNYNLGMQNEHHNPNYPLNILNNNNLYNNYVYLNMLNNAYNTNNNNLKLHNLEENNKLILYNNKKDTYTDFNNSNHNVNNPNDLFQLKIMDPNENRIMNPLNNIQIPIKNYYNLQLLLNYLRGRQVQQSFNHSASNTNNNNNLRSDTKRNYSISSVGFSNRSKRWTICPSYICCNSALCRFKLTCNFKFLQFNHSNYSFNIPYAIYNCYKNLMNFYNYFTSTLCPQQTYLSKHSTQEHETIFNVYWHLLNTEKYKYIQNIILFLDNNLYTRAAWLLKKGYNMDDFEVQKAERKLIKLMLLVFKFTYDHKNDNSKYEHIKAFLYPLRNSHINFEIMNRFLFY
ncbi:sporozoite and liver stage asparagine-rich protein [Plasmodium yoelii]|uniref:Sporozoite and liver stage asparagine-rich protein n=2 Tax=Plasmodium yoelii TaxID=5861 RepID=A0AAE9WV86_PLAYO|nr:sporozoite and liver stage asparagine-rich protein [Plasmodium yoelii]ACE77180.1 sporozoite and liver stage asparagine-rich protein [Plasmodium yoelii]WBY57113.1 sporozoite and liver stage asparagine-rich protein [Plasmodium yoelii yoelii]CDU17810.1 sporozoite and liver stage asparagine-rich protein [Plasmodium yoelii]VTZ78227.1 sporozoite and liver stage asparagine-rich protein [Plasmodium yoelii]|eukprot:XP_022812106.1 sporozoite and liver stage asparagine-rich protein [Plasmodium yoelii]